MSDPLLSAAPQLMARDKAVCDAIEDGNYIAADHPDSGYIWSGKATFPVTKPTASVASVATAASNPPALNPSTNSGTKRKHDGNPGPVPDVNQIEIPVGTPIDASCNVVRGKINRFLESGEMKVGEFCDALGVSAKSYRNFMAMNGKDKGAGSDTYMAAWEFFKNRDIAGLKTPKKRKTAAAGTPNGSGGSDVSDVHLEGEENDEVEVYDTCDEIRKKIAAHLRKPGVTQAQLCRDLLAQYHTSEKRPSQVQSAQLTRFRGYKGADTGNTSCVFYAAYVYFEKLRIKENRPKSKHREEMERIWNEKGGFNVSRGHHRGYYCMGDQRPYQDQYGRVSFH